MKSKLCSIKPSHQLTYETILHSRSDLLPLISWREKCNHQWIHEWPCSRQKGSWRWCCLLQTVPSCALLPSSHSMPEIQKYINIWDLRSSLKDAIICDETPCSFIDGYQHFGETCLYLFGWEVRQVGENNAGNGGCREGPQLNVRKLWAQRRAVLSVTRDKQDIRERWGGKLNYRIFRPITRALSIQKGSEIIKNEHARYTLERFPTNNSHVICTKKGIGKYGIMY